MGFTTKLNAKWLCLWFLCCYHVDQTDTKCRLGEEQAINVFLRLRSWVTQVWILRAERVGNTLRGASTLLRFNYIRDHVSVLFVTGYFTFCEFSIVDCCGIQNYLNSQTFFTVCEHVETNPTFEIFRWVSLLARYCRCWCHHRCWCWCWCWLHFIVWRERALANYTIGLSPCEIEFFVDVVVVVVVVVVDVVFILHTSMKIPEKIARCFCLPAR